MYVNCKSCGRKFPVFPPSGDLSISGQQVHVGSGSIEANRLSIGPGGGLSIGPGGRVVLRPNPPPRYRCPHCGSESEYSQNDIKLD